MASRSSPAFETESRADDAWIAAFDGDVGALTRWLWPYVKFGHCLAIDLCRAADGTR
jgi:hypothetical protein